MAYDNPSSKKSREASCNENLHTKQEQGSARKRALLFRPLKDTETSSKLDHDPLKKNRYETSLGEKEFQAETNSGKDPAYSDLFDAHGPSGTHPVKSSTHRYYHPQEGYRREGYSHQGTDSRHPAEASSLRRQHDQAGSSEGEILDKAKVEGAIKEIMDEKGNSSKKHIAVCLKFYNVQTSPEATYGLICLEQYKKEHGLKYNYQSGYNRTLNLEAELKELQKS